MSYLVKGKKGNRGLEDLVIVESKEDAIRIGQMAVGLGYEQVQLQEYCRAESITQAIQAAARFVRVLHAH
jgi:hypothetical protein